MSFASAIFDSGTGLKKINVQLDTRVVLKSMLDQARIAVMKAVASATDTTVPAISELSRNVSTVGVNKPVGVGSAVGAASNAAFPLRREPSLSTIPEAAKRGSSFGLAQSSSSTSSTDPDEANRLKKARTSALRLNSVLHGRSLGGRSASGASSSINLSTHRNNTPHSGVGNSNTSGSTIPQVRSVRFDHLIRAPKLTSELTPTPNPEKLRMAQTASKLKSYKSFGRPHAGDFGTGPRNATFGEFGFAGAWGRDGRLAAHPMPGQSNPFDAMLESGGGGSSSIASGGVDRNATFNLSRNSGSMMSMSSSNPFLRPNGPTAAGAAPGFSTPAAASGAALLNRVNSSAHTASPSMPRTATALESMFVKKWT
jgi:hypothetical protein